MSTGQKPPAKPATHGWESVVYTVFGALGCYFGVWVGPWIRGLEPTSIPDVYGAIGGMSIGFILASILNGVIVGMKTGK